MVMPQNRWPATARLAMRCDEHGRIHLETAAGVRCDIRCGQDLDHPSGGGFIPPCCASMPEEQAAALEWIIFLGMSANRIEKQS